MENINTGFSIGILGGGLTGLTLAYLLKSKGISCEIVEKNSDCGGLLRSLQAGDFVFDTAGSHIIFSKDEQILKFILKLLERNLGKQERNTKILYKDLFIKYPFENGLHDLPTIENYQCLYSFINTVLKRTNGSLVPPSNLREWLIYAFGNAIAEKYLLPYNEKIWKYPLDSISLEWVERVPMPTLDEVIKSSLGIKTEGYIHQLHFYYPLYGGIEALIKALEVSARTEISNNFNISRISIENGRWLVSDGNNEKIYDKIISTIPIVDLVYAIDAPEDIINAANNLKYNSLVTIMLGVDVEQINTYSWLYIPQSDILFNRVSFPNNFSSHVVPPGKSSVLVEITCNYLDDIWNMDDNELMNAVISQLSHLKIIDKSTVIFKQLCRAKYAYVIYDLNYKHNIELLYKYFQDIGVDLVGRFSEFKYLNMDGCIRSAIDYVERVYI